jgi:hypothetical protein
MQEMLGAPTRTGGDTVRTFIRKCVKEFKQGNFELEINKEYLTSDILRDDREADRVMVFTKYWVRMPLEFFDGEKPFTTEGWPNDF